MRLIKKKKCRNCRSLFVPDPRNRDRQEFCFEAECRKASKVASQKKWLTKPENSDYFRGPDNVKRVQEWRKKNKGYWNRAKKPVALQDSLMAQPAVKSANNSKITGRALQDLLTVQPPVIIGLISNFIGSALQEDIASTLLRMQQFGQDILCLQPETRGGKNDCKNPDFNQTSPQDPPKLQLDRSPTGTRPAY